MADFRSERMPTPEGEGNARDAWDEAWTSSYRFNKAVNERLFAIAPWIRKVVQPQAGRAMIDLLGFWLIWHVSGGFEGVQKATGMSRAAMYRRIALFREVFGEHPDVLEFPGITIDLAVMAKAAQEAAEKMKKSKAE
ncbi:MAG: hypothetical protein V4479_14790 [Actinomycetota bacterium]